MQFIDFSSAFNTIIPQQLIHKLNLLGLNTSLCNWILDFFLLSTIFYFHFFHKQHNIISKIKQNKTADTYSTSQSSIKGRERGKDNKNTKVTPLNNHVYSVKNTAKPQWLKAWPHRLAPLYIHMRQFAGGYGSNMPDPGLFNCKTSVSPCRPQHLQHYHTEHRCPTRLCAQPTALHSADSRLHCQVQLQPHHQVC